MTVMMWFKCLVRCIKKAILIDLCSLLIASSSLVIMRERT